MLSEDERETTIRDVLRYLAGDRDEDAEDAYFSVDTGDAAEAFSMLGEIANRSKDFVDPINIGIGPLDSLVWRYGNTHPGLIADVILGNARLIQALAYVRGLHRFPELKSHLPAGMDGD
jgi:hypothetical protein